MVVAVVVLLGAVLFALVAGSRAERIGAGIVFANVAAAEIARMLLGGELPLAASVSIDILTALAFGALALRYPDKLWPGVAGVAMTFVMVFSATRAIGFPLNDFAHAVTVNLSGLLVQAALVAGTWRHRWGGRRHDDVAEGVAGPILG